MVLALLWLALSSKMVLDWGDLVISVPRNAVITKHRVNFETDEYTIARSTDGRELLQITVGGGAHDLTGYTVFCLNHRKAWRSSSLQSMKVVVGAPGVNAVAASYSNLPPDALDIARQIMKSIEFRYGRKCR